MKKHRIALVPGDGVGPEIVPQAIRAIEAVCEPLDVKLDCTEFPWGAGHYKTHGRFMPEDGLEQLAAFDAVLFGAVGLPDVDDTLPAKDYTFKVRTGFQEYVNYRPVRRFAGVDGPLVAKPPLDFVVIRENCEGEFVQVGSVQNPDAQGGFAIDTSVFTRAGIERIATYAFGLARTRRHKVTNVTKSNTLIHSLAYWDRVVEEVAARYEDVEYVRMYVDAASANFVLRPESFDVILTTNMIGDILSDLGAALMGSLGLGGSGNLNPTQEHPSMFEPIHGSAPDIAGRNLANPIGTIWSGALMLDHLGHQGVERKVLAAVDAALADGVRTPDLGGTAGTKEMACAIIERLA